MRYFVLLLIAGGIYLYAVRGKPASTVATPAIPLQTSAAASPAASPTNLLKRPLDRTHEVLDQVRRKNQSESF